MKPTVLVLTSTYPRWRDDVEPGFVHELSRRLESHYDVHVLAPHCVGALPYEVLDGVHVHRFRYGFSKLERLAYNGGMLANIQRFPWTLLLLPFFLASQLLGAYKLSRKYNVALVHAHWVIPQGIVAAFLKVFRPKIPLVVTSHGGDVYGLNGAVLGFLKRKVYEASDVVTVVSEAMAEDLRSLVNVADIQIAPMGVDLQQRFVPGGLDDQRRDIVFVGRLVEKKGVGVLLEAFAKLHREYPLLRLRIVGDGPSRVPLMDQVVRLSISEAVEFLGAVPNTKIPGMLNEHAIAVVPSIVAASGDQEGLGLVAIEAMGCGCALIASDLPALHDIVDHGRNGLLFEVGNVGALVDCLRELLDSESFRCRLAKAGRESVVKKFDWVQAVQRYHLIFSELI